MRCCCLVEGLREPQNFRAIAEMAANAGKPLIAAKVGSSQAGQRATASHTAHLAGSDAAYQAMFDRYGVIRCFDPDDMISAALALTSAPLPHGNRVGMITVSGGNAILMTDLCEDMGLDIPPLSEATPKSNSVGHPDVWIATKSGRSHRASQLQIRHHNLAGPNGRILSR